MSSTAVLTMATTTPTSPLSASTALSSVRQSAMTSTTSTSTATTHHPEAMSCCPGCGFSIMPANPSQAELMDAQARIAELESQVRMLNQKASSAIDRWADYEQELHRLRAQQKQQHFPSQRHDKPLPDGPPVSPTRASILQAGTNRLSAMLTSRKSTPNLRSPDGSTVLAPPLPGMPPLQQGAETHDDLRKALTREQSLRKEAEGKLNATSKEVEELSVTLFEQANEMVAEERRARARLEERVGELERRDTEKKRRLERLEMAMGRIDRAKALLNEE